jgi:hypothetical protein
MKNILTLSLAPLSLLLIVACGSSNNNSNSQSDKLPQNVESAIDSPTSTISQELLNTLSYMGNEERLAYDVYNRLYAQWGTQQFTNIANNSEIKHIQAVQGLVQKYKADDATSFTNVDLPALGYMNTPVESMQAGTYDISTIQKLYDDLVSMGMTSEMEALKVGCTIEVVDITDLDAYITLAQQSNATDIVEVFNYLRDGSYTHYWAFDKSVKNSGAEAGCCTWSELCHPEYPQSEKGNGKGNKKGKGKG